MVGDEVRRLGLIRFVNTLYVFTRSFTFVLYVVEKQRFFFKKGKYMISHMWKTIRLNQEIDDRVCG